MKWYPPCLMPNGSERNVAGLGKKTDHSVGTWMCSIFPCRGFQGQIQLLANTVLGCFAAFLHYFITEDNSLQALRCCLFLGDDSNLHVTTIVIFEGLFTTRIMDVCLLSACRSQLEALKHIGIEALSYSTTVILQHCGTEKLLHRKTWELQNC